MYASKPVNYFTVSFIDDKVTQTLSYFVHTNKHIWKKYDKSYTCISSNNTFKTFEITCN